MIAPSEKVLTLSLKREYFEAIKDGSKLEEFRERNDFWKKRIEGKTFSKIVLTLGYPKSDDFSRRIELPWRGYRVCNLKHPHFGDQELEVFAIRLTE